MGTGSASIMVTIIAVKNNIHVLQYKETFQYAILVLIAGVSAIVSSFVNVIVAKNLRHPPPPPANNQQ